MRDESSSHLTRRATISASFGTVVEWYDFFLYGTAAALIFPHLFFPSPSSLTGSLLSFATFAAGFIACPLGGAIFGHVGDRLGRKNALVVTLLAVGLATLAVGLLPCSACCARCGCPGSLCRTDRVGEAFRLADGALPHLAEDHPLSAEIAQAERLLGPVRAPVTRPGTAVARPASPVAQPGSTRPSQLVTAACSCAVRGFRFRSWPEVGSTYASSDFAPR